MKKFLRNKRVKHEVKPIKVDRIIKKKTYELSESQKIAKMIAAEVCGLQPYEKKAIEYIKSDNTKKARKFLKIRLGSLTRAEKKFEQLMKLVK
ncbi:RL36 [Enterospora canceri]|uniref:RL36 n=1 Tax=Enterospora canceri TaxID=1081671 RepID=A0A1Y1S6U5_9MICR|nr:RL36 [Enterospora canceri]